MRFSSVPITALLTILATALSSAAEAVEQGDRAPPWRAADFTGRPVDFPAVGEGKPVVVVFWATWCPYCRAFMPYLKGIQADYAAQGVKSSPSTRRKTAAATRRDMSTGLGFAPIAVANGDPIAVIRNPIHSRPADRRRRPGRRVPPPVD